MAEDPDAHLLPDLRRAWDDQSLPFQLRGAEVEDDAAYGIRLRRLGGPRDLRGVRAAAFTLIGAVAESATYFRQRSTAADGSLPPDVDVPSGGEVVFEVATGMLEPDTSFATHGHVLLLRVALPDE